MIEKSAEEIRSGAARNLHAPSYSTLFPRLYVASRQGARSASEMQSCWLDNLTRCLLNCSISVRARLKIRTVASASLITNRVRAARATGLCRLNKPGAYTVAARAKGSDQSKSVYVLAPCYTVPFTRARETGHVTCGKTYSRTRAFCAHSVRKHPRLLLF